MIRLTHLTLNECHMRNGLALKIGKNQLKTFKSTVSPLDIQQILHNQNRLENVSINLTTGRAGTRESINIPNSVKTLHVHGPIVDEITTAVNQHGQIKTIHVELNTTEMSKLIKLNDSSVDKVIIEADSYETRELIRIKIRTDENLERLRRNV